MKKQNICKFITKTELEEKEVLNFIYEQNTETMAKETLLSANRAGLITNGEIVLKVSGSERRLAKGELFFAGAGLFNDLPALLLRQVKWVVPLDGFFPQVLTVGGNEQTLICLQRIHSGSHRCHVGVGHGIERAK